MSVPSNFVQAQGQASVSADQINTFVQSTFNVAMLRSFIGVDGMQVLMEGFVSMGDGGQGTFGWLSTSSATDDGGVTCIQPTAAGPTGRWLRIPPASGGGGGLSIARAPVYVIDGGGSAIGTGLRGQLYIPFGLTIQNVSLLADQSGSCVVDIGLVSYAAYAAAFAGSITASAIPTISGGVKYLDTTLIGWTTVIPAGSCLLFKVVSAATITRLTITLGCVG